MRIENPIFYSEGNLPSFLKVDQSGLLSIDPNFLEEGSPGPYNRVVNFGHSRDFIREPVPVAERITANCRPDITFLGFDNPIVATRMRDISRLANSEGRNFGNPADRQEYRLHLELVYREIARAVAGRIQGEQVLYLPPKNGGIFVQEVYEKQGISEANFFDFRMSRLLKKDGELMVGIKRNSEKPSISDFRNFVFCDDCLASDISAWGTLEMIKEELQKSGCPLAETRVILAVSAATQRGLESLLSREARNHFGFGRMEAVAAVPVRKLSRNFYLLQDDGSYTVGDMGKWSLPPERGWLK